jgi:predicted transcriptional regulator
MERWYLLAKIERGFEQLDAGDVVPHEEAKRRLLG